MTGEGPPSSELRLRPRALGIDRLSMRQCKKLGGFIGNWAPWLLAQFEEERHVAEHGGSVETAAVDVQRLAGSGDPEQRGIAASFIAEYAEIEPEHAFDIWAQLVNDEDDEVQRCAKIAFVSALGRRQLDSEGVMKVIDAWWEPTSPDIE
jgi:hypothetical protein